MTGMEAIVSAMTTPKVEVPKSPLFAVPLHPWQTADGVLSPEECDYVLVCRLLRENQESFAKKREALVKAQEEFDEYQAEAVELVAARNQALAALIASTKQD